jgi:hypothetical protein
MGLKFNGIGSGVRHRIYEGVRHPEAPIMRLGHLGHDETRTAVIILIHSEFRLKTDFIDETAQLRNKA